MSARGLNRRQAFAAHAAAIGQRGLAALARITVKKSVLPFAADFRWLILAFHKLIRLPSGRKTGACEDNHETPRVKAQLIAPKSEGGAPRRPEIGGSQSSLLRKFDDAANDSVQIEGTNFAATFSRSAGTLTSLVYDGREMLASDKKVAQASRLPNVSGQSANSIYPATGETPALLSGPVLQVSIRLGRQQLRAGCWNVTRFYQQKRIICTCFFVRIRHPAHLDR
jgi:hypothetical protein